MPDQGQGGSSWWTTLPGVLTGLAGLIGAVATLLTALEKVNWASVLTWVVPAHDPFPDRSPAPNPRSDTRLHVGDVDVAVVTLERSLGAAGLDLTYRVFTGPGFVQHDPLRFVHLLRDGVPIPAVQASAPAGVLQPDSNHSFRVRFAVTAPLAPGPVLLRFGEQEHIEVPARLPEERGGAQ